MSKNLTSASIVALALLLWLGSGIIFDDSNPQEQVTLTVQGQNDGGQVTRGPTRVRAEIISSQERTRYLVLRGRTESKRMVEVKAEIAGKVVARPVERGMRVQAGDLLCEVAVDDRAVAVTEAEAALEDARIEHEGSLKLREQGLQSQIAIARSASRLEAARAQLQRQVLNLQRTRITAPFNGVVEELHMNTGDYAVPAAPCATLIDLDPMLVRTDVTETEVEHLRLGGRVYGHIGIGRTGAGPEIEGVVTFIGKQNDPTTRTYPVEITVDNADYSIRSGLTVGMRIGLGEVQAHRISPALFTLNDKGELGVRTLDKSGRVEFHTVRIIEDGPSGVWVTGLPRTTRLITVGQEFVAEGEMVEAVYLNDPSGQLAQP